MSKRNVWQYALLALVAVIYFHADATAATAAEKTVSLAAICAARDVKVIILIEEHGEAQDVAPEKLAAAFTLMLQARDVCYKGRVTEAVALYDGIIALDPVLLSRRTQ